MWLDEAYRIPGLSPSDESTADDGAARGGE